MLKRITFIAIVCAVVAGAAWAEGIELTPTYGYRYGGTFAGLRSPDGAQGDFSISDDSAYGLLLDLDFADRAALEFGYSRESADIKASPSFDHLATPDKVDIDSYQMNVLLYVRVKNKAIRPFFNVGIGAENFSPNNGLGSQSAFTLQAGGGAKFYFAEHFGVRVQANFISAQVPGGHDTFCNGDGLCYEKSSTGSVNQTELSAGLIFRF